jgi:hypothetical protein
MIAIITDTHQSCSTHTLQFVIEDEFGEYEVYNEITQTSREICIMAKRRYQNLLSFPPIWSEIR